MHTVVFTMDSGPFLDVIPIILSYLDFKSLINLAKTCQFWRYRIYNDFKLWPKHIELPFLGHMKTFLRNYTPEQIIQAKLWSMLLPPEDPNALEIVLEKMASSNESIQRFQRVEKVDFKNFIHTDESLRLTALLFPSIKEISFEGDLFSIAGVQHIAESCKQLKHIEFYNYKKINISDACRLFNTEEHKQNIERILIHSGSLDEGTLPFMALCSLCGLYYNELKNEKEMLCLHHPGKYSGYGHSCSSFDCCGSNTPRYPSTLGCQYTYHQKYTEESTRSYRMRELHQGHPEYMLQKYRHDLIPLNFTSRRNVRQCTEIWNKKQSDADKLLDDY